MAAKKILCILIAAAFFCSFGLFSFAEDVSLVLTGFTYGYYQYNNPNNISNSYDRSTFPIPQSLYIWYNPFAGVSNGNFPNRAYQVFFSSSFVDANVSPPVNLFYSDTLYSGTFSFVFLDSNYQNLISYFDFSRLSTLNTHFYLADNKTLQSALNIRELLPGNDLSLSFSYSVDQNNNVANIDVDFEFYVDDLMDWGPFYLIVLIDSDTLVNYNVVPVNYSGSAFRYYPTAITVSYDSSADNPFEPDDPGPDDPGSDPEGPNDVQQGLDYEEQKNEEAYEGAVEGADTSAFDLSSFATSFSDLFDGLNYQGTDFHFMFPGSGNVPYLNKELWPSVEIPFKEWIDKMPSTWLTIARFLAWLALAWAFVHKIKALIQDINGGDEE